MVISLERGADLHIVQLMPMPLTVSCFSKIQIGFTFLVPAYPDKGPLNGCVCNICKNLTNKIKRKNIDIRYANRIYLVFNTITADVTPEDDKAPTTSQQ